MVVNHLGGGFAGKSEGNVAKLTSVLFEPSVEEAFLILGPEHGELGGGI